MKAHHSSDLTADLGTGEHGLVVIDEPKANGSLVYGGAVAAPVFQSIAAEAVRILGIDPDLPEELQGMSRVPLAAARLEGEGR